MRTRRCGKYIREKIGVDAAPIVHGRAERIGGSAKEGAGAGEKSADAEAAPYWDAYRGGRYDAALEVDTGVAQPELATIGEALSQLSRGIPHSSESEETAGAAAGNGAGQAAD